MVDTRSLSVVETVKFSDGSNPLTGTLAFDGWGETFFVPLPGCDAAAAICNIKVSSFEMELIPAGARPMNAVCLEAPLPDRQMTFAQQGVALAVGRTFPAGCPDRCCDPLLHRSSVGSRRLR